MSVTAAEVAAMPWWREMYGLPPLTAPGGSRHNRGDIMQLTRANAGPWLIGQPVSVHYQSAPGFSGDVEIINIAEGETVLHVTTGDGRRPLEAVIIDVEGTHVEAILPPRVVRAREDGHLIRYHDSMPVEYTPSDGGEPRHDSTVPVQPIPFVVERITEILKGVHLDPQYADMIHDLVDARLVLANVDPVIKDARARADKHIETTVLEQAEFPSRNEQIRDAALKAAATACAALAASPLGGLVPDDARARGKFEPSIRGIIQAAAEFEKYIRTGSAEVAP